MPEVPYSLGYMDDTDGDYTFPSGAWVCGSCFKGATIYGEVIPGIVLVRMPEGRRLGGHWGLAVEHSCVYNWERRPSLESEDDSGWGSSNELFLEALDDALLSYPVSGHALVEACLKAGYDWEHSGLVHVWIGERIAAMVAEYEVKHG
jgi:hypothetical protein